MKRPTVMIVLVSLAAGLLAGGLAHAMGPASSACTALLLGPGSSVAGSSKSSPALNSTDNIPLLQTAAAVVLALKEQDYAAVADFVHPDRGVTLTPYSTVDFETDRKLTWEQLRNLEKDETVYTWGFVDGRGSLIELTMAQYFRQYVFNADYSQAPEIGIDQLLMSGNALENLTEAYPGCRFVDFCHPGLEPANEGMDWCSLRLVFEPSETSWFLVGIVHGQWTI